MKAIADAAKSADRLMLATDPDREGEAISWHVMDLLKKRKALPTKVERVTFNAITKQAVTEAMKAPRELDQDLIDAYLAAARWITCSASPFRPCCGASFPARNRQAACNLSPCA